MHKFKEKVTGEVLEVQFDLADNPSRNKIKIARLDRSTKKATKYIKRMNSLNPDGTVPEADTRSQELLNKAERALKDGFAYAFGEDAYKAIFSSRRPYAQINGTPWVSLVLIALADSVEENEAEKMPERLNEKFIATLKRTEDGKVIIPFEAEETGELMGELLFDPTFKNHAEKFSVFDACTQKSLYFLTHITSGLKVDGTVSEGNTKDQELLEKAEKELKEGFDTYFGCGAYDSIFAKRKPYAFVQGTFYMDLVMKVFRENVYIGGTNNE